MSMTWLVTVVEWECLLMEFVEIVKIMERDNVVNVPEVTGKDLVLILVSITGNIVNITIKFSKSYCKICKMI